VASISALFGTGADAGTGVLLKIAYGLSLASVNCGEAEDAVTTMFKEGDRGVAAEWQQLVRTLTGPIGLSSDPVTERS
jgi:hypothetical protein